MASRRRRLSAAEVARILASNGFALISQKGSHQKWRHAQTRKQVIVPVHSGAILPIGTLRSIQKGSGLPDEVWENA